jgi:hypothetical protein
MKYQDDVPIKELQEALELIDNTKISDKMMKNENPFS